MMYFTPVWRVLVFGWIIGWLGVLSDGVEGILRELPPMGITFFPFAGFSVKTHGHRQQKQCVKATFALRSGQDISEKQQRISGLS